MPEITLNIKYGISTKNPFSAQDLRDKFLVDLPINDKCRDTITDELIEFYIASAKDQLESHLGIRLDRSIIKERKDYFSDDWVNWGFLKATFPVQTAIGIDGYLGDKEVVRFPKEWIVSKNSTDNKTFSRNIRIVPNASSATFTNLTALYGGSPILSWWRQNKSIPNYWYLRYITGFPDDKIPNDILHALGMIAVIPILGIISDQYAGSKGLGFGVGSKSISLDGLSQSVSTYSNGQTGIFGARMKQYSDQLLGDKGKPGLLDILKDAYSAIIWGVC